MEKNNQNIVNKEWIKPELIAIEIEETAEGIMDLFGFGDFLASS